MGGEIWRKLHRTKKAELTDGASQCQHSQDGTQDTRQFPMLPSRSALASSHSTKHSATQHQAEKRGAQNVTSLPSGQGNSLETEASHLGSLICKQALQSNYPETLIWIIPTGRLKSAESEAASRSCVGTWGYGVISWFSSARFSPMFSLPCREWVQEAGQGAKEKL